MKNYISNSGYDFKNFGEVIDEMKNTNNSISVKGCKNYRAALLKNDGVYTLKIFYIGKDFNAYFEKEYVIGHRLTKKAIEKIETIMDYHVDNYEDESEKDSAANNVKNEFSEEINNMEKLIAMHNLAEKITAYVKGQICENDYTKVLLLENGIVLKVFVNGFVSYKMYDESHNVFGFTDLWFDDDSNFLAEDTLKNAVDSIVDTYRNWYVNKLRCDYENGRPMVLPNGKVADVENAFSNRWQTKVKKMCPQIWFD